MRNFIQFLLQTILLSTVLFSTAQTQSTIKVVGVVLDAETRQPLPGANILVQGTGWGTSANPQGLYQLENVPEGIYTISAAHIGYARQTFRDVRIPRDLPVRLNFYLKPKIIQMKALEISADRWQNGLRTDQVVIKQDEIEDSNYQSVGEILEQVPGLEIENTGTVGSSKKISIRGSQSNQVLVLLDGIPLNDESGGSVDLATIPTNIIEKVEVHKGGNSARFGSGAIGGVIRISTKSRFKQQFQVNSSLGSFGAVNVEPNFSGNYGNFGYFISYNFIRSNGDYPFEYRDSKDVLVRETRINADYLSQNGFVRLNYKRQAHTFSVQMQQLNSDRGLPGKINGWTAYARAKKEQRIWGGEYKFNNRKLNFKLSYRNSDENTENSNLYPADADKRDRNYPKYHYQYRLKNHVLNTTIDYVPANWLHLTLGYTGRLLNYRNENLRPSLTPPVTEAEDLAHGVFLTQEYKLTYPNQAVQLSLTPAIRYDELRIKSGSFKRFDHQWSPGLNAFFSWGRKRQIYTKAGTSHSFRVPTFADLFYQEARIEGKPDLLPEKSRNYDYGAGWQIDTSIKFSGEVTHFHYTIDDLIVWRLGSFEVFRPFNTNAEISGEEYSFSVQAPNDRITLEIGYTDLLPLNKNKNETTYDKIIPYRPQSSLKAGLGVNFESWHLKLNYREVGARFITEANTKEMPPYAAWDANLVWNRKISGLELRWKFSIFNLTDEKYEIIRDMPLPPREWRFGVNVAL